MGGTAEERALSSLMMLLGVHSRLLMKLPLVIEFPDRTASLVFQSRLNPFSESAAIFKENPLIFIVASDTVTTE